MVDAWWVAVGVYTTLLVGQRLWRARRWVPPEWPEADYGWKVTHLLWVPFNVLDVVFGVALLFALLLPCWRSEPRSPAALRPRSAADALTARR